jgi:V8-like Glu-specific endopeptidase
MRRRRLPRLALASAAAAVLAACAACADQPRPAEPSRAPLPAVAAPDEGDPFGTARLVRVLASDRPPRVAQITDGVSVRLVGTGRLTIAASDDEDVAPRPRGRGAAGRPADEPVDALDHEPVQVRVFNSRTLLEFEITFSPAYLRRVHLSRERRGLTGATETVRDPGAAERGPEPRDGGALARPFALSNGVDTRIIRTPTSQYPLRTIAQFTTGNPNDSHCTGTLIGPRHLITAAHCFNPKGTSTWATFVVNPGRDGNGGPMPYGSSVSTVNPPPGKETWYFTPSHWRANGSDVLAWDWGLVVIPDRLGDQTGWMGYTAQTVAALTGAEEYNRGYPACNTSKASKPAACVASRDYGDTHGCVFDDWDVKSSSGWYRTVWHNCDTSPGQSGSAVYHYFDVGGGNFEPVVSLVHGNTSCNACDSGDDFPNRAKRLIPADRDVISWLRETFP